MSEDVAQRSAHEIASDLRAIYPEQQRINQWQVRYEAAAAFERLAAERDSLRSKLSKTSFDLDRLVVGIDRMRESVSSVAGDSAPMVPQYFINTIQCLIRATITELSADARAQQTPFDEWTDDETLAELEKLADSNPSKSDPNLNFVLANLRESGKIEDH